MSYATMFEKAEQQLLGYFSAKKGDSLEDLLSAMGFTREDFDYIKKNYPTTIDIMNTKLIEQWLIEQEKSKSK